MHILVTGGAGYIGSHVVKQLLEETSHRVTIVDNLSTGHQATVDTLKQMMPDRGRLFFEKLDLSDFMAVEKLFKSKKFDAVMHFAASIVVPESVANPLKYYMNNTVNTTHLVSMCVKYGVEKFIFSSTAAVYGEPSEVPVSEDAPLEPINPYGMSKLMSERIIQDAAAAHEGFDFVILRYFNVAGADERNRIGQSFPNATHLVKIAAQTASGLRDDMCMFGSDYDTPDGTCIRDYIHVDDLASAHLDALRYLVTPIKHDVPTEHIFNVGYGHGYSVSEVVTMMKEVSGQDFKVLKKARRQGDPAVLIADNANIMNVLRWQPRYDGLETICRTALAWEKKLAEGV